MPKVSVIVPNYNHADYLRARIDSVLQQSFQDFELIILDDCSTDNSRYILEEYRDEPKVSQIVYNETNSGSTFKQWHKGISLAKGEWIWIAESDDVAREKFLEVLIERASISTNDVSLAFCASDYINENGDYTGDVSVGLNIGGRNWSESYVGSGVREIKEQLYYKSIIPNASAAIFKKSAVSDLFFDEVRNMKFAGDWLFWIKVLQKGDITYSAQKLNNFRNHSGTTRNLKSFALETKRFQEFFDIVDYVKSEYGLGWNVRKHLWIIDEWVDKYFKINDFPLYADRLPLSYNIVIALKIIKNKISGKLG